MAEAAEVDLQELLLQPIRGASPAGEDLRLDASPQSLYFRLRDARAEARAAERLADNDPSLSGAVPAQWSTVHALTMEALTSRSKDIEIACWLTEGLTRRHGLAGLADGTECLVGLISRYWDSGLFPSADDEDQASRLFAITGMSGEERDGSLLQPLRKIQLFTRQDGMPVTFWEFERSREVAALGIPKDKAPRAAAAAFSFSDLEVDALGQAQASLVAVGRDVARAQAAWHALEQAIGQVAAGGESPSTGRVRGLLESLSRLVERYAPAAAPAAAEPQEAAAVGPADAEESATDAAAHRGPKSLPVSRDAMLDEILRIASAFRQNEPNSPLSFTLEEAVRRARLSWPELLRELMPDLAARAAVMNGAGVKALPE